MGLVIYKDEQEAGNEGWAYRLTTAAGREESGPLDSVDEVCGVLRWARREGINDLPWPDTDVSFIQSDEQCGICDGAGGVWWPHEPQSTHLGALCLLLSDPTAGRWKS